MRPDWSKPFSFPEERGLVQERVLHTKLNKEKL